MASVPLIAALIVQPILASVGSPNVLPTPPMGFNNWARFECNLNETLFVDTANAMVLTGLRDAGYNRLNLDDCWMQHKRAKNGSLQWDTTKFPHGIPWLANYVKQRGFHLGIYEDSGTMTCGGYPGSFGHEQQDADTFASWGIDYLKLDGCNVQAQDGRTLEEEYKCIYGNWHQILSAMQNPLIFSESAPAYFVSDNNETDWYTVMDWVPLYGELARHSYDILVYPGQGSAWDSIMTNYHYNTLLARYQRPGYFNDPDFLIVDHPGLTMDEKQSHFALWASFSAPMIISAYIPALSDSEISYLTNKDLIAVNQDALSQQATLVSQDGTFDVLTRTLANGDRLLTVLNRGSDNATTSVPVERLGLNPVGTYNAKNLWDGTTQKVQRQIEITLASHATSVHRISMASGRSSITPTGMVFNTASMNCLTATSQSAISFETCNADSSQVWQATSSGALSPLSAKSICLTSGSQSVSLAPCNGSAGQNWVYSVSGNLMNENTSTCLTEGSSGASDCGFELDSQVFALPSGVNVDWKSNPEA